MLRLFCFCLVVFLTVVSSPALAKPKENALNAPLPAYSAIERAMLEPHHLQGPVVTAPYFYSNTRVPAATVSMLVQAPPCTVYKLLGKPSGHPDFMAALDSVEVVGVDDIAVTYKWRWKFAVFDLYGESLMVRTPPKHPSQPYRIEVQLTKGDLGIGRQVWRIYPHRKGSLVTVSSRFDMRKSNFITEQLSKAGTMFSRSITISLSMVSALGMRRAAENLAGKKLYRPESVSPLREPSIDADYLHHFLKEGDMVFLEMDGDTLVQSNILSRTGYPEKATRELLSSPEEFTRALMKGSKAQVESKTAKETIFSWEVPVPMMNVGGTMRNYLRDGVIYIEGVKGALKNGKWRFRVHRYPWNEAAVIGWSRFDPAESAALVRTMIGGDQYFSHGIVASLNIMMSRSLRVRLKKAAARKRKEARRKKANKNSEPTKN